MSRHAIAAVLARDDLSSGERLVAFSLASFADRENRARPGTPAAAERAGLKHSWFLEARDTLVRRGLVIVEQAAAGRGRASTLWLPFADAGPWWEGEINARLLETVLGYSRSRGTARLLLASMAALADEQRRVEGVTTERLSTAAGVTDRAYRRARATLLALGELVLRSGPGGRGNTNCWEIPNPRSRGGGVEPPRRRRVAPPLGQRPLVASVPSVASPVVEQPGIAGVDQSQTGAGAKGGPERTVSGPNRPVSAGVSVKKSGADRTPSPENCPVSAGVSVGKGGADRTLSGSVTPAQTPAKTPAPDARAGREPQNPRTLDPPGPPEGGSVADELWVEETYVTDHGRTRKRMVRLDVAAVRERLAAAGSGDRDTWEQIRELLLQAVGESTFAIWLAPLELIAVDPDGSLVIGTPEATRGWVQTRFGRLLQRCAEEVGRRVRFGAEHERVALEPGPREASAAPPRDEHAQHADAAATAPITRRLTSVTPARAGRPAADRSASGSFDAASATSTSWQPGRSSGGLSYTSPYRSSYTSVDTRWREVS